MLDILPTGHRRPASVPNLRGAFVRGVHRHYAGNTA